MLRMDRFQDGLTYASSRRFNSARAQSAPLPSCIRGKQQPRSRYRLPCGCLRGAPENSRAAGGDRHPPRHRRCRQCLASTRRPQPNDAGPAHGLISPRPATSSSRPAPTTHQNAPPSSDPRYQAPATRRSRRKADDAPARDRLSERGTGHADRPRESFRRGSQAPARTPTPSRRRWSPRPGSRRACRRHPRSACT